MQKSWKDLSTRERRRLIALTAVEVSSEEIAKTTNVRLSLGEFLRQFFFASSRSHYWLSSKLGAANSTSKNQQHAESRGSLCRRQSSSGSRRLKRPITCVIKSESVEREKLNRFRVVTLRALLSAGSINEPVYLELGAESHWLLELELEEAEPQPKCHCCQT